MSARWNVITGATGLLGSHIAEALRARGGRVRALVRPTSDVSFLREQGVDLVVGDLHDPQSLLRLVDGADVVYHCAARVGDWGPWRLYQREIVEATRNVLAACQAAAVGRVVHVSSVTVYGHPGAAGPPIAEDAALGQNLYWFWDYYCRSKIAAEELARAYGPTLTVVRPSWIYGPRDRNTLPRLLAAVQSGRVALVGGGDNLLNIVYAADVAEGAIRAAEHPAAGGRAYNLCSEGVVTQRQFLDALTDALGQPRVRRRVPFRLAYIGGLAAEAIGRAIFLKRPPRITRYAVGLIGRPTRFRIDRAREELDWQPRVDPLDGLARTLAWWRRRDVTPPRRPEDGC